MKWTDHDPENDHWRYLDCTGQEIGCVERIWKPGQIVFFQPYAYESKLDEYLTLSGAQAAVEQATRHEINL